MINYNKESAQIQCLFHHLPRIDRKKQTEYNKRHYNAETAAETAAVLRHEEKMEKKEKKRGIGNPKRVLIELSKPVAKVMIAFRIGKFQVVNYKIQTGKLARPLRIVLIADLHDSLFGENQRGLIEAVDNLKPDAVMLAGDIFVEYAPHKNAVMLLKGIAGRYPCFYVTGNHEYFCDDIGGIKDTVRSCGVEVLEGGCKEAEINGQTITVCGLDDPRCGEEEFDAQLNALAAAGANGFTILLSHRPELVETYKTLNADLVLSGHAHGGQWRIPGLLNGLYAPEQGWFPKYAGGLYSYNNTVHIVSRGLARYYILPRIGNPTELLAIDIEPKQTR